LIKTLSVKKGVWYTLFIIILLVIDQTIKVWVKTHMCLHESRHITDWFYLSYIENNGMAYGMTFIPKYALSLFRLVACCALVWYIGKELRRGARTLWTILLSLVLAGAAGNLIDCMFYGLIFNGASSYYTSFFVPFGTGYAGFLQGRVVDMFYFPLIVTTYPEWFPFWGGEQFIFFSPIFNFADACISVGVVAILLFCHEELTKINEPTPSRDAKEEGKAN
jgi:signal peptidase II